MRSVSHAVAGRPILRDVSFRVAPGEIVAVLVGGGMGRSTFARVVAGLLAPEGGAVVWDGRSLQSLRYREARAFARRRGFAAGGEPGLFDDRTLAENVAFPLRYHGAGRREVEERVQAVLGRLAIARHADAFPPEVPAGVRARAALARALVTEPDLVVLDDPFADLSAAEYDIVEAAIRDARDRFGTTFVVATAHLAFIYKVPDRIVGLFEGKVVVSGPREEVLASEDVRVRDLAFGRG